MTNELARQCSVILPAASIAMAVQIRAVERSLDGKVNFALSLASPSATTATYPRSSPQAIYLRQTDLEVKWWRAASIITYAHSACVILAEYVCLGWLAGASARSFYWITLETKTSWGAEILIALTVAGVFGAFMIPAVSFAGSASNHPERLKDALWSISEK